MFSHMCDTKKSIPYRARNIYLLDVGVAESGLLISHRVFWESRVGEDLDPFLLSVIVGISKNATNGLTDIINCLPNVFKCIFEPVTEVPKGRLLSHIHYDMLLLLSLGNLRAKGQSQDCSGSQ